MMKDLEYSGINNFATNESGFAVAEDLLNNNVFLSDPSLDKNIKFKLGYNMLSVAPIHNGYGINGAKSYFSNLFAGNVKLDLDVLSGMFFICFYELDSNNEFHLYPKYSYLVDMLKYVLRTYDSKDIQYILDVVDEKTPISISVRLYLPEEFKIIRKYLGEDYEGTHCNEAVNTLIKVITAIINERVDDRILEYEFQSFLLKFEYINKVYYDL